MAENQKQIEESKEESVDDRIRRLEARDAPMTVSDESTKKRGGGSGFGGGSSFLLMAFIAAVVCFVFVKLVFPSPSFNTYTKDINSLQLDVLNVRQTFAQKSDIPSLATVDAQLTSLSGQITTEQTNLTALQATVNGIKPFDPATINTSITTLQANLASLTTQYNTIAAQYLTMQGQIAAIKPTDITALTTSVTTLQTSATTMQTSITALQTSVTALNTQIAAISIPGISVTSMQSNVYGMQAIIHSDSALPGLATIKYTFVTPIVLSVAPPTLALQPFGAVTTQTLVEETWDSKVGQIEWLVRLPLSVGNTTLTWNTSVTGGIWSISMEVAQ